MNWQHFRAFVWLRWRLLVNQSRRAGAFNAVLTIIVGIGALVTAIPLFIGCFVLGLYAIPKAAPMHLLYVWDGVIVAFLFFWTIGLITELQRTESLVLSKFLHLPVSVNGAFLINYFSSLLRLSLIVFVPIMSGFSLALIYTKGISLLPVLPSLAAFLLMVSALTYQFQGWLASLMSNPRRRRTVVVTTTVTFVLIVQLPNLLNFFSPWGISAHTARVKRQVEQSKALVEQSKALTEEMSKLQANQSREVDPTVSVKKGRDILDRQEELQRRLEELTRTHKLAREQADRSSMEKLEQTARLANMVLPVGWLPIGVMSAAEGNVLPSILGLSGMTLIGTASLWRAYRTTIAMYQGRATSRQGRPAPAVGSLATARKRGDSLLEARIHGLSEPVSAIALGTFRSLLRSPEAKMMLLSPVIMIPIFGSMLWGGRQNIPELVRPLVAVGGIVLVLFGLLQMMSNQFGFDRDGFRVFVLCAASRRDILFGKNLAFVPVALVLSLILLTFVQIACPMRLDHFLATFPQAVSMFLLFCILVNFMSIFAPFYVAAGSLKPATPKLTTVLLQLVMFMFLFPLTQATTLIPLGIEAALRFMGWPATAPINLGLSLVECAVIVILYHFSLIWQGSLFQAREQQILESVTNRAP